MSLQRNQMRVIAISVLEKYSNFEGCPCNSEASEAVLRQLCKKTRKDLKDVCLSWSKTLDLYKSIPDEAKLSYQQMASTFIDELEENQLYALLLSYYLLNPDQQPPCSIKTALSADIAKGIIQKMGRARYEQLTGVTMSEEQVKDIFES
ncbi:MAG: hypothetical protein ACM3KR_02200 [Deltaproteobacteria bacterium]